MTIRHTLATMTFAMAASFNAYAQEAQYPDYNALRDTIGNRMMAFYMQHKEMDMGQPEFRIDVNLGDKSTIDGLRLPPMRKKRLAQNEIYPLCKPSTLIICQADYRPATDDFYLDIFASAVAITEDGTCLSNYHVFEDLLKPRPTETAERHFIRFAADAEGNIYPVRSVVLADSLNDFSIFTVDTRGRELSPMPIGTPATEGEDAYCISHPKANFYYLTRGIVARNQSIRDTRTGKTKLEMQITADYAVCSSGGPIIDSHGNLIGIVGSTTSLYADPNKVKNFQMSIKKAVPIKAVLEALRHASAIPQR